MNPLVSAGNYTFTLTLEDRNEDPLTSVYNFDINISDRPVAIEIVADEVMIEESDAPGFMITRISMTGEVQIEFSEQFFPVSNASLIDTSILDVAIQAGSNQI